jgi:hypothetical protein
VQHGRRQIQRGINLLRRADKTAFKQIQHELTTATSAEFRCGYTAIALEHVPECRAGCEPERQRDLLGRTSRILEQKRSQREVDPS